MPVEFCSSGVPEIENKKSEMIDTYLEPDRGLKKVEHQGDGDTICSRLTLNGPNGLRERREIGNPWENGNC